MKISDHTTISELIKANKGSIEAIAGAAKPLQRLKNPVLRRVMASRVTIAEAAKMGGCSVDALITALSPLGFVYERSAVSAVPTSSRPQWLLQAAESDITRYDVRPIIESGTDPLKAILGRFKDVPPGGILCIINSFVPSPLIHLLEQEKAEGSYVDMISPKESHTYFLKKQKGTLAGKESNDKVVMDDAVSFQALYDAFPEEKIRETDVRSMEMPMPMQTILAELGALPEGHILYVHHKRVPVYLLEELADKNYEVHIHAVDESNVKMILFAKQ